jgi:hypothetical protein
LQPAEAFKHGRTGKAGAIANRAVCDCNDQAAALGGEQLGRGFGPRVIEQSQQHGQGAGGFFAGRRVDQLGQQAGAQQAGGVRVAGFGQGVEIDADLRGVGRLDGHGKELGAVRWRIG